MTELLDRHNIEHTEKWRDWVTKAPYFNFPKSWSVQITPPFAGVMLRFRIKKNKAEISVYMDTNNSLGYYTDDKGNPVPYWEIYPYDGDTFRCGVDEIDLLMKAITKSIKQQNKKNVKI